MDMYVLSQIFAVIATIFIGLSYLAKTKKRIMLLCVIYCIFYSSHYFLLGAYTGCLMSIVSAFRNILFYYYAKKNLVSNKSILFIFLFLSFLFGIISYQDIFSLLSIVASFISTYSIWQNDVRVYRKLAILVSICFISYAIHINSIFSLITEIILLIVEIIGIMELRIKDKEKVIEVEESL